MSLLKRPDTECTEEGWSGGVEAGWGQVTEQEKQPRIIRTGR